MLYPKLHKFHKNILPMCAHWENCVYILLVCKQVLKIIRYTTKLVLASAVSEPQSELAQRLKAFEGSIGTSRLGSRIVLVVMLSYDAWLSLTPVNCMPLPNAPGQSGSSQ